MQAITEPQNKPLKLRTCVLYLYKEMYHRITGILYSWKFQVLQLK